MDAVRCFVTEIERRDLDPDRRLYRDMIHACGLPFLRTRMLQERLIHGAAVLDRNGDMDAPQALWDRWETIFAAYDCCLQAMTAQERMDDRPTPAAEAVAPQRKQNTIRLITNTLKGQRT